jgi:hypothetical protein
LIPPPGTANETTEALHLGRVFGFGNMAGSQKKNNAGMRARRP